MFTRIKNLFRKKQPFSSAKYWESRYSQGGNSGEGSYDRLAEFKADVINKLIADKGIESVIEFGMGDGNQLSLLHCKKYTGLDVSAKAVEICSKKFAGDPAKDFHVIQTEAYNNESYGGYRDMAMSLDVIFHLVEDAIYEKYLTDLFSASEKYILVYSSNQELPKYTGHEKHRNFTRDVERLCSAWRLEETIDNIYPASEKEEPYTSYANFYLFVKK